VSGDRRLVLEDGDDGPRIEIRQAGAVVGSYSFPEAGFTDAVTREKFLCRLSDELPSATAGLETSFLRKRIRHLARKRAKR